MKNVISTLTIIGLLMFVCLNGVQAQNNKQAEKLMKKLRSKDLEKALTLVQNVENVNYTTENNVSLLMLASSLGYVEVCEELIDKGAEMDMQDIDGGIGTALMWAAIYGHTRVAKL